MKTRTATVKALRSAAQVLMGGATPAPLRAVLKKLQATYPETKFEIKSFARPRADTTWWVTSSDLPNERILTVTLWPAPQGGSDLFDVEVVGQYGGHSKRAISGAKTFPTAAALLKVLAESGRTFGKRPNVMPADPKISQVKVSQDTTDEWVMVTLRVTGDWFVKQDSYKTDTTTEAFARRVFEKALPMAKAELEKAASKSADVWQDGSSSSEDPAVRKSFPMLRTFDQVEQIDFEGNTVHFLTSER